MTSNGLVCDTLRISEETMTGLLCLYCDSQKMINKWILYKLPFLIAMFLQQQGDHDSPELLEYLCITLIPWERYSLF